MNRPARIPDTGHTTPAIAQWPSQRRLSAMRPMPRRGLSRTEAAVYVGVGATKFDELVATGQMPKPKRIDNRKVWDIVAVDRAFDLLPSDERGLIDRTWED
jgi:predicted DNA-binding transcriptional regulator AlpA